MPNGVDVPDLTILSAPGSGDDPVRATFALWIAQWMTDLGMSVTSQPSDLDSVVDVAVEPDSTDAILGWDLHVLGWGRPNLALPGLSLVALFHSRNGVESGGVNTTGYASAEFDAAADAFVAARSLEEAATWTKEMERIIATDLPYVTLYRPAVIEGFDAGVQFPVESIIGGHAAIPGAWPESVRISP
jgi:ABC-type transport system substrate-binding protein